MNGTNLRKQTDGGNIRSIKIWVFSWDGKNEWSTFFRLYIGKMIRAEMLLEWSM